MGCGMISEEYLKNMIEKFSILDVVGCCDLDAEKATACAQQFGMEYMTMDEICADPTIEIVVNLSAPPAHYAIIKNLLLHGKNVYSEKTLTVDLSEAKELVELADEKGLYLGVAPDTFLGSSVQTARHAVKAGMIGKVTSCKAQVLRDRRILAQVVPFTTKLGCGIGFDVGIYYLTALLSILGPIELAAGFYAQNVHEDEHNDPSKPNYEEKYSVNSETIMSAAVRFSSGVLGTMMFNSDGIFPEQSELMLCGTEGVLTMGNPNDFGGKVYLQAKGNENRIELPCIYGFSGNERGLGVAEMAWAIRSKRPCRANKEMAYHALDVLHGIIESCQTSQFKKIDSSFRCMPPLPSGYLDENYYGANQESALR